MSHYLRRSGNYDPKSFPLPPFSCSPAKVSSFLILSSSVELGEGFKYWQTP